MLSKLKAARLCTAVGIETQIINGFEKSLLSQALLGEKVGSTFLPRKLKDDIKNRERWLLAAKTSAASIEVDDGAVSALALGKSLLAVGIKKVYGEFDEDELVEIVDKDKVGVAIGKVDLDSKLLNTTESKKGLQVMHADNIMVFV